MGVPEHFVPDGMPLPSISVTADKQPRDVVVAVEQSLTDGNWEIGSTWAGGAVPVTGDTVYVMGPHTVMVNNNLYGNTTYMFLVIVGTLDLTNNGKLDFNASTSLRILFSSLRWN